MLASYTSNRSLDECNNTNLHILKIFSLEKEHNLHSCGLTNTTVSLH